RAGAPATQRFGHFYQVAGRAVCYLLPLICSCAPCSGVVPIRRASPNRPHVVTQAKSALPPESGHSICAMSKYFYVRPARSIFSNALNFRCSAIAALVWSPRRYCPLRSLGGPPLPLGPPCNRHRPFLSLATGRASHSWSALRTDGPSEIVRAVGFPGAHIDAVVLEVLRPSKANHVIDRLRAGTPFVYELAG